MTSSRISTLLAAIIGVAGAACPGCGVTTPPGTATNGVAGGTGVAGGSTSPGSGGGGAPGGGAGAGSGVAGIGAGGAQAGSGPGGTAGSVIGSGTDGSVGGQQGGPPPSGITISINGTIVPKEKAVVFIHLGHSDMAGRALEPPEEMPFFYTPDPHLWIYSKGGVWKQAVEPTAPDGEPEQGAGPGMALLRTGLTYAPGSYMISIGVGRSGRLNGWCPNFKKSANLFYPLLMAPALELKGKVTFAGIFTMLGITEYHGGNAGLNGFGACLADIATSIRADLGEPNLPMMVGSWNALDTGIYSPTGQYGAICVPQMKMVPGMTPPGYLIPTDMGPYGPQGAMEPACPVRSDGKHLTMTGHRMWAARALRWLSIKNMPWATP